MKRAPDKSDHPLRAYRKSIKLSLKEFGALVDANESMISKWELGVAVPRKKAIEKIFKVTKGAVTPNHFLLPRSA